MEVIPREAKNRNSEMVFKGCLWTVGLGMERKEKRQETCYFHHQLFSAI